MTGRKEEYTPLKIRERFFRGANCSSLQTLLDNMSLSILWFILPSYIGYWNALPHFVQRMTALLVITKQYQQTRKFRKRKLIAFARTSAHITLSEHLEIYVNRYGLCHSFLWNGTHSSSCLLVVFLMVPFPLFLSRPFLFHWSMYILTFHLSLSSATICICSKGGYYPLYHTLNITPALYYSKDIIHTAMDFFEFLVNR